MAQRHTSIPRTEDPLAPDSALWQKHSRILSHNLPLPRTTLVGRERERTEIAKILLHNDTRLLTLSGMGGVGKTRLALAVTSDIAADFPDGVFFIPLSTITDKGLLASAISQALEIYTLLDETVLPTLLDNMRDMNALLLLDNFEQLYSAAPILAEILANCPRVKLLVTSRTRLNLQGEQEIVVQPLSLPSATDKQNIAAIAKSDAVQLFVQRAAVAKSGFVLNNDNAPVIADICARLDALPLAIELAAARVKLLSPKAIQSRLQKRLHLLTGGAQDLPARQQTLRDAINWSYELLTPDEQRLFRLLSVFSDGCTLETMQAVYDVLANSPTLQQPNNYAGLDLLELATSLVNKSLLRVVESDNDTRILMLETVREFAGEQLALNKEDLAAKGAHAAALLSLVEDAETALAGPDQLTWLNHLEQELGNLRTALEWCADTSDINDPGRSERLEMGLGIAGKLTRFWQARSHLREGVEWLANFISRTPSLRNDTRARALRAAGRLTSIAGDSDPARVYYQEALDIARELDDRFGITKSLMGLGLIEWDAGRGSEALRAYEECLLIWQELGHKPGIASTLSNIGMVLAYSGDPNRGIGYLEKSIRLFKEVGDNERTGVVTDCLARSYLRAGDLENALHFSRQGVLMNLEIADNWNIAYSLVTNAEVASANHNFAAAARFLGAAEATYDNLTDRLMHPDLMSYQACLFATKDSLGDVAFRSAWEQGQSLSVQDLLASSAKPMATQPAVPLPTSLVPGQPAANPTKETVLTSREREVLILLSQGLSNAELAERLVLSFYTVNAHLRNIYSKLNISSRVAAARYAHDHGLV